MARNDSENSISHHILPTSANLLGICFLIFSIIRISGINGKTIVDELCLIAILLFMCSCILSYFSLRSIKHPASYERWADTIFIIGLGFLCLVTVVTALGFVV